MTTATKPAFLRHSMLSTFQGCGRKMQLEYLTPDVPRIPQGAFHGGLAVHEAIEWAEKEDLWKLDTADVGIKNFALDSFQEKVTKDGGPAKIRWAGRKTKEYPQGENYDWWIFWLGVFTRRWLEIRRRWDFEGVRLIPKGSEMAFRASLPSGQILSGRADAVMFADPDGQPYIVDWKTGQKGASPVMQLATYAWGISQTRGLNITKGQFVYLRGPQIDTHDLTPYLPLVPKLFGDLERGIESGVFMISPSNFCISCPVRLDCEWGSLLPRDEVNGLLAGVPRTSVGFVCESVPRNRNRLRLPVQSVLLLLEPLPVPTLEQPFAMSSTPSGFCHCFLGGRRNPPLRGGTSLRSRYSAILTP